MVDSWKVIQSGTLRWLALIRFKTISIEILGERKSPAVQLADKQMEEQRIWFVNNWIDKLTVTTNS